MSRLSKWILADAGLHDEAPLRYVLGRSRHASRRSFLRYVLLAVAFIGIPILTTLATDATQRGASAVVYDALYGPTIIVQALVSAMVFGATVHFVHDMRGKKVWDSLRATAGGSSAAMRAAWAGLVYYRLSGPLGALFYAPRLVLLGLLLWDLTAFRGDYLSLIVGGHQPSIPPPLEVLLLGAFVASAFLLPLSAIGLEAAVGLLFATFARSRTTATLLQIAFTAGRFFWCLIPAALLSRQLAHSPELISPIILNIGFLATSIAGDLGLSSLNVANIDTIWSNVNNSAYYGIVFLGFVLLHSALTALILRWASRRAQAID